MLKRLTKVTAYMMVSASIISMVPAMASCDYTSGAMLANTTVGGYVLGANGAWVQQKSSL